MRCFHRVISSCDSETRFIARPRRGTGQGVVRDLLSLGNNSVQVRLVLEAFRVELVYARCRTPRWSVALPGKPLGVRDLNRATSTARSRAYRCRSRKRTA